MHRKSNNAVAGINDKAKICLIHFHRKKMCFSIKFLTADEGINTKNTDAQGILKPKSVIPREEGGLGFLIITRA